jgi:antibiotic biosynthesis monooxygenase (ABM) superfamily enzyme
MDEVVDDRNPTPGDDPAITVVASRRVKPGREREFEEWVFGILAAQSWRGLLGRDTQVF